MRCKGQISVFIIVGVVLIMLLVLGLIYQSFSTNQIIVVDDVKSDDDFLEAQGYIEFCMNDSAKLALVLNGQKGGLYEPQQFDDDGTRQEFTYHYQKTWTNVPSVQDVELSLEKEFDILLNKCIDVYNGQDDISMSAPNSKVTIEDNAVSFSTSGTFTITNSFKQERISDISTKIGAIHIPHVLNISKQIGEIQATYPDSYCDSCIAILALETYSWIDFVETTNLDTVYTITDLRSELFGYPYEMVMAHDH